MKRASRLFIAICAITCVLSSCATMKEMQSTKTRYIRKDAEKRVILIKEGLYDYAKYLEEGVASIAIREKTGAYGDVTYDISRPFYKKAYVRDYDTQMELLKTNFPELYSLYRDGRIIIHDMYKFVNRRTGTVRVNVRYRYR